MFDVVGEGADGGEALLLAHRHTPTILLMDTSMPVMDGLEALPLVLAVSPHTKVVVFTGFEERGLADRARELGASAYIEKSTPIHELVDRLWSIATDAPPDAAPRRSAGLRLAAVHDADAARDQAALDEHLERYREVFDQAAIGMATMTLNGSIVRANQALADMIDCDPGDLVGLDYGVLTRRHGDQLDDALARLTEGVEDVVTFEHPLANEDRPTHTARVTLTPIRDSKQEALYVFAQIQDVTAEVALRRSEESFRLLVTAVKDYAIYMLDTDGNIASWNAGAQYIKGYSVDEVLGQHFRMFYPPEDREAGHPEQNLRTALRFGVYVEDGWRLRRDGSRFWARVVITPVYDDTGQHRGFAKVTRDQTEQREHEEQRRRAAEQQAHLLAVTAHELRTPTAVVEGAVTMMQDHADELGEGDRDLLLKAMASSALRLRRLVDDLRAASDVQADALTLAPETISLRGSLNAAAERARAADPKARITVSVDQDVEFDADPGRLGQALDNLLENALRHGRPPVSMRGEHTSEGVRMIVSDAGPGVEPRLRERLFERFAHAGPAGGTGLGLYLVREIARIHGGEASYVAEGPGGRTAFVIDLPKAARIPR